MNKNLLSVGIIINKQEQLKIIGGVAPDCEPGEIQIIICITGENCP
jgi:hypothetical protein